MERVRSFGRRLRFAISDLTYGLRRGIRRVRGALIPDRMAGSLGRLRFRVASLGRRIASVLRDVGGGIAAGARRLEDAWMSLSVRARQSIAAAVGAIALAAILWFGLVPVLPCQFPAGDRCPPPDDAVELVPADALAYVHTNLESDSDETADARALAERLPLLSSQLIARAPLPGGGGAQFGEQVLPWLGGEVALAVIAGEGGTPEQVYLLEVGDQAGAEEFAGTITGADAETAERGGVEIQVDKRGVATAITEGFLVIGTEVAVQRLIDAQAEDGRTLADSPVADAVDDALPDDSLVQAYVSEDGVQRLLAGGQGPLSSLDSVINFEATVGAGAALTASADGLELEVHSELDQARLEASPGFFDAFPPFEPTLTEELAPKTLGYLGLGDPEASVELLLDQARSQAPDLVVGFEKLQERVVKIGKVSLTGEVLPVLGGEGAFAIEPPTPVGGQGGRGEGESESEQESDEGKNDEEGGIPFDIPGIDGAPPGAAPPEDVAPEAVDPEGIIGATGIPYLTFIGTEVDEEAANEALAKLQAPLAEALQDNSSGQQPTFDSGEVAGIPVQTISVSPSVELTYAVFDDQLVVSTQPTGVERVAKGDGGLSGAPPFERATDDFPDEPALLFYLNLRELLGLAEAEGLAEDPAYGVFAAEARQLGEAALAVERGELELDSTLRVSLLPPPD